MTAYEIIVTTHSYLRWILVGLFIVVIARAARGWAGPPAWSALDDRLHLALVAGVDVQVTLGLLLYAVLSPISAVFFAAPGVGMRDATLRFFGVEHATSMILALTMLHVGRVSSKRAADGGLRRKRVFGWTLSSLLLVLIGLPWPFLRYGRPLLRHWP